MTRSAWKIPSLSGNGFIHLAIIHTVLGVLSSALQIAVYICVVQYGGNVYLTSGNLVPPLLSFGIVCGFTYFWTALQCVKIGNQLRVIAATRASFKTVRRFRRLSWANLALSCLLVITSAYLVSVTVFWYHVQYPTRWSESVETLVSAGKAAMVIHVLHLTVAVIEIILNLIGLSTTPEPQLRLTITYQPQGFATGSLSRPVSAFNGSIMNGYSTTPHYGYINRSAGNLQSQPWARSNASIVSDF